MAFMVALPVAMPKQLGLVSALALPVKAARGCVMLVVLVVVQPFASLMVQVQLPAGRLFAATPVCTGAVSQL